MNIYLQDKWEKANLVNIINVIWKDTCGLELNFWRSTVCHTAQTKMKIMCSVKQCYVIRREGCDDENTDVKDLHEAFE